MITDELRKYTSNNDIPHYHHEYIAIADRIDAEHERVTMNVMNDALYCANEDDMAELGWIRLPKDANDEYVNIGDVMAYADNTKPMEVVALVPPAVFLTEDGPRYADMCRHYKPAVEDVLEKALIEAAMLDRPEGYWPSAADITNIVNSLAAKLQLKEDE